MWLTGHIIHHITCTRISGYKFRFTFRSLSDVSYSDECRTKKSFSVWLKHGTAFSCCNQCNCVLFHPSLPVARKFGEVIIT